tara:strand:+ start:31 stop:546 length:516 start_codon:yes stop_codon:yes gene_type:complete
MVKKGGGILPVAIKNNEIYFLFSREGMIPKTKISGKWSDFGGSHENNETVFQTAVREGFEESNNMFESIDILKDTIKRNWITSIQTKTYITYLFKIDYDDNLPEKFEQHYNKVLRDNEELVLKYNGLYEKDRVKWIKLEDILEHKHEFRVWYIPILFKIKYYFENLYCYKL